MPDYPAIPSSGDSNVIPLFGSVRSFAGVLGTEVRRKAGLPPLVHATTSAPLPSAATPAPSDVVGGMAEAPKGLLVLLGLAVLIVVLVVAGGGGEKASSSSMSSEGKSSSAGGGLLLWGVLIVAAIALFRKEETINVITTQTQTATQQAGGGGGGGSGGSNPIGSLLSGIGSLFGL